jgi:DNA-binding CsgD family transcriptional regulator
MAWRFGQGDLLAGGAASVALPVLVFVLDLDPLLAIPLVVAIYIGLVLLRPVGGEVRPALGDLATEPNDAAYQTALDAAAAIRALGIRIAKPAISERVVCVADRLERTLEAMRADGYLAAAPLLSGRLEPFCAQLKKYIRVSTREVKSAADLMEHFEACELPTIERAVDAFYDELNRADVLDLAVLREALESDPASEARLSEETPAALGPPAGMPASEPGSAAAANGASPAEAVMRQFGLTRRQLDILLLVARRLSNREISQVRFISVRTVENHVAAILAKTGLESRGQLHSFAVQHGLMPPDALPMAPE